MLTQSQFIEKIESYYPDNIVNNDTKVITWVKENYRYKYSKYNAYACFFKNCAKFEDQNTLVLSNDYRYALAGGYSLLSALTLICLDINDSSDLISGSTEDTIGLNALSCYLITRQDYMGVSELKRSLQYINGYTLQIHGVNNITISQ